MIPENGMLVYDGDECAVYRMWIALYRWAGVRKGVLARVFYIQVLV